MEGRALLTGVTAAYVVQSDWGSGFQAQLGMTNTDPTPVSNWKLEFDLPVSISSIWDAQVTQHIGNHYVITGLAWDATIPANSTLAFGFVAGPGGPAPSPSNYLLNGAPLGSSAPQLPGLTVGDVTANVGASTAGQATFTVGLLKASTSAVTVSFATADGTAKAGVDYVAKTGTLTFAPGETTKTVAVSLPAAAQWKADSTFSLNLSGPSGATLARTSAVATVHNTNTPPATGNIVFTNTSDWGSGFTGQIDIKNPGTTAINNWTLAFDFAGQITSLWNGSIASHVGNHFVIQPASWNASIPAGGSVSFGFNASPGGRTVSPTNYVLTPNPGTGGGGGGTVNPPSAVADSASTFSGRPVTISVLANDTDPNGLTISIASTTAPAHGGIVVNPGGTITYTANPGFLGSDTFNYTITDNLGGKSTAAVTVNVLAAPAPPTWTAREFSPYVDMTLYPTYDLVSASKASGVKDFTLAFIVADSAKQPSWGGYSEYEVNGGTFDQGIRSQITSLRAIGGDVMVSFGGAANQELAEVITDPVALKNAYETVINAYNLTHIDFDIEGAAAANRVSIDRRSQALALVQKDMAAAGKPLEIWFTLPVLPTGLTGDGVYVVQSAIKAGVQLGGVNVMAMDFGDSAAPNPSGHMGDYAIQSGVSLFAQLRSAYGTAPSDAQLWSMVGITPMIGVNDVSSEVFDQAAANQLVTWGKSKGIGRIAMWSVNRDQQSPRGALTYAESTSSGILQQPYEFSKIFQTFVG